MKLSKKIEKACFLQVLESHFRHEVEMKLKTQKMEVNVEDPFLPLRIKDEIFFVFSLSSCSLPSLCIVFHILGDERYPRCRDDFQILMVAA